MSLGQQSRYIGRVGALAVALGVGGFIVGLPAVATADTGAGSSGKTTSSAGKQAPRNSKDPGSRTPKPATATPAAAAKPYGAVSAASRRPMDRLGTGNDPLAPVTEPLSFAVLAVTRRDGIAKSARSVNSGGTAAAAAASVPSGSGGASGSGAVEAPLPTSATASSALDTAVRNFIDDHLPGLNPIADQLAPIVANGIQDLLSNGKVAAEVNQLATNDTILQFVSTSISNALGSNFGVPQTVGVAIGNTAANFVRNTLGNADVQSALDVLAYAVRPTDEQNAAIEAGLAVDDVAPLGNYLASIVSNSTGDIATFLSDPAVQDALGSAVSNAVLDFTGAPVVPAWLGNVVAGWVTYGLGGAPAAAGVGDALGNAVQGLLSNTKAMQALATVAGTAVTNILGAQDVPAALAEFVTQFGTAVMGGADWISALGTGWQGLQTDSAFLSALGPAAGDAVHSLATNSDVVSALAATVTGLVNDVAGNADIRTFLGTLVGPTYGPLLVSTLADPTSAAALAATAGAVVTSFLSQAGVATALSAPANQIVTALLSGGTPTDVLQGALQSVTADPAVMAAFNATVPTALKGALKAPAIQQVIIEAAHDAVVGVLDYTPLKNTVFYSWAGQATEKVVDTLVSDPTAQYMIGDLAGDILDGASFKDVAYKAVDYVLYKPKLQIAVGMAVGQGIASVLGDNVVTDFVGKTIGAAAAVAIGMTCGTVQILDKVGLVKVPKASTYYEAVQAGQLATA